MIESTVDPKTDNHRSAEQYAENDAPDHKCCRIC